MAKHASLIVYTSSCLRHFAFTQNAEEISRITSVLIQDTDCPSRE
jgi:hypothetical protein